MVCKKYSESFFAELAYILYLKTSRFVIKHFKCYFKISSISCENFGAD